MTLASWKVQSVSSTALNNALRYVQIAGAAGIRQHYAEGHLLHARHHHMHLHHGTHTTATPFVRL